MQRIIGILLLLICCLTWSDSYIKYNTEFNTPDDVANRTSAGGKYMNLLYVIEAPEDKIEYGLYFDWGYWFGDSWGEYTNLKPGFWVYVYPKWYVWEKRSDERGLDPKANADGEYFALLYILNVPEDVNEYGSYCNFGFWEVYSYAGYDDLTPGYWVYVEPNWYIWADTKNIGGT